MNKKIGFTLSEIMVALGIVAVLAAILVPSVMSQRPDDNKIMMRKAYSILSETVFEMLNDDSNKLYPYKEAHCNNTDQSQCGFRALELDKYYVGTTPTTGEWASVFAGSIVVFVYNFEDQFLNHFNQSTEHMSIDSCPISADGISWCFSRDLRGFQLGIADFGPFTSDSFFQKFATCEYCYKMKIDVNGEKKPNCSFDKAVQHFELVQWDVCEEGVSADTFIVGIRYDGKLQVGCSTVPVCSAVTDQYIVDVLSNPTDNSKD